MVVGEDTSIDDDGAGREAALTDNVIVDVLTGEERKWSDREEIVQRTIRVLAEEYRFPLEQMARDVSVQIEVNGRRRRKAVDIAVYKDVDGRELADAERLVVVRDPKTKTGDKTKGVESLEQLLDAVESCEFGLWTNGRDVVYMRKRPGPLQNSFEELSDFPGSGESIDELDRPDRRMARVAVAEDLRETVLRCHDYLYGNQSMRADRAFGELIKLIFCKIYDERVLRSDSGASRRFWVGVTERNNADGQQAITSRIKALFEAVKRDHDFRDAFRPGDELEMQPKALAWVAGELARYDFLSAEVDVKGLAYEAVVATTMKRERGQFFTPRNVVQAMVEILAPAPGERVLDPACGSGRFLVACLDRFRRLRAEEMGDAGVLELRKRRNSRDVLAAGAAYARDRLFGIDIDPELVRAARMNMLINNDGHGNIVEGNSLELTPAALVQAEPGDDLGFGTFDVVLTNPPFGAKIPVDDPIVLGNFDLAHGWERADDGSWLRTALRSSMPPEILFIERCLDWLRDGGRMGIVLPDGILGNPDLEPIRAWILRRARVLASIDLPVETFLPQVGVQASLVFLEKRALHEVNAGLDPDYEIFMAVVEQVGHNRRGGPIFRRDPDGIELWREEIEEMLVRRGGSDVLDRRAVRRRVLADDLPLTVDAYMRWIETGHVEILDKVGA